MKHYEKPEIRRGPQVLPGTFYGLDGWHLDRGVDWRCERCGTTYGSNLKGERPFWYVSVHRKECQGAK